MISFPKSERGSQGEASRPLFTASDLPGFHPPTTLYPGNPPSDAERRDASATRHSTPVPPIPCPFLPRLALPSFAPSLAARPPPPTPETGMRLRRGLCALVNLSNYPYREPRRGSIQYQPPNQPTASRILASHPATPPNFLLSSPAPAAPSLPLAGDCLRAEFLVRHATPGDSRPSSRNVFPAGQTTSPYDLASIIALPSGIPFDSASTWASSSSSSRCGELVSSLTWVPLRWELTS